MNNLIIVVNLPFQIVTYHPVFLSNNCNNISLQCEVSVHSDTPAVVLAVQQPYFIDFTPGVINEKYINIRIIKLRCISASKSWSHLNNRVVLTILTFRHIECLHLIYAEVAWVLVSLGTQVQSQIILKSHTNHIQIILIFPFLVTLGNIMVQKFDKLTDKVFYINSLLSFMI